MKASYSPASAAEWVADRFPRSARPPDLQGDHRDVLGGRRQQCLRHAAGVSDCLEKESDDRGRAGVERIESM